MKVSQQISMAVQSIIVGEPFLSSNFLAIGSRAAVDQALYRMAKSGEILRVARGVYVKPKTNALIGAVQPGSQSIVAAISKATGETIGITGVEAERLMGLTTQMQIRPVYTTSGRSRTIRAGKMEIQLKHVSSRKLSLATKPAGIAMLALWNRGQKKLNAQEVKSVINRLEPNERKEMRSLLPLIPGWLAQAIGFQQRGSEHA